MVTYKKILIPVDFSEHSEFALKKGISLAQIYQANVYFLHVGDEAQKSARKLSAFIKRNHPENPGIGKKLVAQGTPARVIISVAKRLGTDVIVMGSRGISRLKHFVQGSVSEKVLREASCPVMIIKKRKPTEFGGYMLPQIRNTEGAFQVDKILVPLDFSPASTRAFHYAAAMASYYNSTIYTLTVFDKKFKEYGADRQEHTAVLVHGEKIRLWKEFPRLLREIQSDLPSARVKRMLLSGDPASRIEDIVQKKEIDLVIMGTNGRTGLEHLLLGSVAEKVLRSVDCAVMTIRSSSSARS